MLQRSGIDYGEGMNSQLPRYNIVLLGLGHTNSHILRMWRMQPLADARLTCISNFPQVTYSGMLPGVLAGQYPNERMTIDLVRLCAASGARLIVDQVRGLDASSRELLFNDRPPLRYDALSIGVGSVPDTRNFIADETALPIKPMQTFLDRLQRRLLALSASVPVARPLRLAVIGGGVGGIEIACCLPRRVQQVLPGRPLELMLINAHPRLGGALCPRAERLVRKTLQQQGVRVVSGIRVTRATNGQLFYDDGATLDCDLAIWATTAVAPPLLESFDLPKDERGFLLTAPTLQSTAAAALFAVGDSGTIEGRNTPKAGVYAVRQGPVLWENLGRVLAGRPLLSYQPQQGFLKLLNTGDGAAIAEYRGLAWRGKWCLRLKDAIDGAFMDKYQSYAAPMPSRPPAASGEQPMRCLGCGGKVGGSVLSRALARINAPGNDSIVVGLGAADDAAIIRTPPNGLIAASVDFFAAPFDAPFEMGRIAALHAASDLWAMGATPQAALAIITLPEGVAEAQEDLLVELLSGATFELQKMGAALAGGHTIAGDRLEIGFTFFGAAADPPCVKNALLPDDHLLLTKPVGAGVLLAAHMQARCRVEWWPTLLDAMLQSNQQAAAIVSDLDLRAVTDITGFGIAGHLTEMLAASRVDAELNLDDIPLLPGARTLFDEGFASTLAESNQALANIDFASSSPAMHRDAQALAPLFDPQTSGGLLIGVPKQKLEQTLARFQERGLDVYDIGRAAPQSGATPMLYLH